ncbi:MAG: cation transporter, partial [Ruminiclostridium sp.]|nr:cation transporter [Ruminiclostridium sp.]
NLINIHNPARDKKIKQKPKNIKEEKTMEKVIKIEGMMCGHCEATVKKALEAIEGVANAEVSHEKGTAVVTLETEIA